MLVEGAAEVQDVHHYVRTEGQRQLQAGRYNEAATLLSQVAEANGRDISFLNDYARALVGVGGPENVQRAVGLLRTAVGVDRDNGTRTADTYVGLGIAYGRAAEYTGALKFYRTAQEINAGHEDVRFLAGGDTPQARHASATALQAEGLDLSSRDIPQALTRFEKAIALVGEKNAPWCVFERGRRLMATDPQQARVDLQTAARLMPDHATVQQTFRQLGGPAPR